MVVIPPASEVSGGGGFNPLANFLAYDFTPPQRQNLDGMHFYWNLVINRL